MIKKFCSKLKAFKDKHLKPRWQAFKRRPTKQKIAIGFIVAVVFIAAVEALSS